MKFIGTVVLAIGIAFGIYAMTMSVGLEMPSKEIGFGITTPAISIDDPNLVAKRKDYLTYAGIVAAVGGLLLVVGLAGKKK
jgi:hypothetical protein